MSTSPAEETAPLPAPEDFNLDEWLTDAKRPERSVTVYKRADLLADLDDLERQIDALARIPEEDQSLADSPAALEAQYLAKAEEFHASGLLVRVKGLTSEEIEAIGEASKTANDTPEQAGRRLVAAALVYPKLNVDQLKRLSDAIGSVQMGLIVDAYRLATMKAPEVTVPFSQKSSGRANGQG